jgi:hypothetical protein
MKEDSKPNPQYTNLNMGESSTQKKDEGGQEKRLEDKPGAYLLKDTAADEEASSNEVKVAAERADLNEDITAEDEDSDSLDEDEFNFNPFEDEDTETQD